METSADENSLFLFVSFLLCGVIPIISHKENSYTHNMCAYEKQENELNYSVSEFGVRGKFWTASICDHLIKDFLDAE